LVDTLHEDLNRVIEKPYVETPDSNGWSDEIVSKEHWDSFTARNKSVIVDLMYGQLKSRLRCYVCKEESNCFDPFLGLQVPIPKAWSVFIKGIYYPLQIDEKRRIREYTVEMKYGETFDHFIKRFRILSN